ncbi:hypothetical protein GA0070214_106331 [Micromonospora chaiyaphumensis]|uniref:Uncharacterized protein n=1 Tax=Micromonospora chaiyaphumensis TaxID=307119 RepID=A0A1C4XSR3_9ACTN|nr:hypothetical protein GA0070214_106331 [Micromonospora chaiyaphumensis]
MWQMAMPMRDLGLAAEFTEPEAVHALLGRVELVAVSVALNPLARCVV